MGHQVHPRTKIDVTTPIAGRRHAQGIDFHTSTRLEARDVAVRCGVPVTTVARTIADLAGVLRRRDLEKTIERADALWSLDIERTLAAARARPGSTLLKSIAAGWAPAPTRSELEDRLIALVRRAGLSEPKINVRVQGFEVDLSWPDRRLVVEADGHAFHSARGAVARDRQRDAILARHGYRVLRFTWAQVTRRPGEVVEAIRAALNTAVGATHM